MPVLARDLMQAVPLTIPAATPFLEVQHLFVEAEIGGAPVVDARGAVIGMITGHDLLRVNDQVSDDEVDEGEDDDDPAPLAGLTAGDLAAPDVCWVTPETPAAEVAAMMRAERIHRVLVGTDGQLAGILTTFDLLGAIGS